MAGPQIPPDAIISPDTRRKVRVPPGQHLRTDWPVLHAGSVPPVDASRWTFSITGLVEEEKTLSAAEFHSLPKTRVFSDIHCVTTWSRLDNLWEGLSTRELKGIVNILPDARFVVVHAAAGLREPLGKGRGDFTTNLTFEDFFGEDVLLATSHDGKPITADHGAPVRLVVPRLYFWKSAKWVTGVEFTRDDRPGFWETRGYHNRGDPWNEERYS